MEKMNGLSKRLDWKVGVKNNNDNQKLIKEEWIHSWIVIEGPEVDILGKMKIVRRKDKEVVGVVKKIKKTEVKVLKEDKWQIGCIIMYQWQNIDGDKRQWSWWQETTCGQE